MAFPFGTKKRYKPPLWVIPVSASSPVSTQDVGGGFPPPKHDPFDFNEDFTEADLEEIDMIASQALAQGPNEPAPRSKNASAAMGSAGPDQLAGKGENEVKDNFGFKVLHEQQDELKLKLKAMQDEILLKNGEIKILRESLTHSNSRIEEQRRAHLLYEKETTRYLSDKEKEFSRKLLSLQTELHFKDAEMNELKLTLQAKEHMKKTAVQAPSLVRKSPIGDMKKEAGPIGDMKKEAGSAKPEKIVFPTKESFSRSLSLKRPHPAAQPCVPAPRSKDRKVAPTDHSLNANDNTAPVRGSGFVKQELKQKSFTHSWLQRQTSRGSILINALLKQPLAPGSTLGLSHLLGSNSETSPGAILQLHLLGSTSPGMSSARTAYSREGLFSITSLRAAQNLAKTGLNMVAMDEGQTDQDLVESKGSIFRFGRPCKFPGAVYLLPLVEYYVDLYCQTLQAEVSATGNGTSGNQSGDSSRVNVEQRSQTDDFLSALEGFTVAALGVLYYLVCYSGDVVRSLLSVEGERDPALREALPVERDGCLGGRNPLGEMAGASSEQEQAQEQAKEGAQAQAVVEERPYPPLFKKLLQLFSLSSSSPETLKMDIVNQYLKILVKLAENSTADLLPRFRSVLSDQVLPYCLRATTPLSAVHWLVQLLALLIDHEDLALRLCSLSETCPLLLLYLYVTSRPDKSATETLWLHLEQEVVQFLAKLCVLDVGSPAVLVGSRCQCKHEVIKTLVVMLHRQWLTVRRAIGKLCKQRQRTVQCLRDTLLLLHTLSQRDRYFHEHCLEVLHQYDQVLLGIRTLFRSLPDLTGCEEMALEELCPVEPDMEDVVNQEMDCS
ncbi:ATR-interacting protein isoform X1 [Ornithorhynchus anatinus]|uniref:ATR interacting protein n=1 Tax=Ornithorhynchus anatinus TaxID=9258 RepID=F6TVY1_ORNAN|nr:ATR-interacting protein isoform X1 [Ornithorhynchus anatinus]